MSCRLTASITLNDSCSIISCVRSFHLPCVIRQNETKIHSKSEATKGRTSSLTGTSHSNQPVFLLSSRLHLRCALPGFRSPSLSRCELERCHVHVCTVPNRSPHPVRPGDGQNHAPFLETAVPSVRSPPVRALRDLDGHDRLFVLLTDPEHRLGTNAHQLHHG